MVARINALFICSRNQWRSPTAEALFKGSAAVSARSAGTSPSARVRVNEKHIRWADIVFVMEKRHRQQLLDRLGDTLRGKRVVVLDVPDDFQFMDETLISLLKQRLAAHIAVPD